MSNIKNLEKVILIDISKAKSFQDLQIIKIRELGKKGKISLLMKSLSNVSNEEKKSLGKLYNELRLKVLDAFATKEQDLKDISIIDKIKNENLDITLPVRPNNNDDEGKLHPITRTIDSIIDIFAKSGFSVETGPDIENDFNNFTALNIPDDHPARQEHDTFYISNKDNEKRKLLRTHTSPVQIRTMINKKPPIRIIAPGRTFRSDDDATHSPMFHQVEGLVIEKAINMGHLKGLIKSFCEDFFEVKDLPVRFRPSYFPFTEPSAEVDILSKDGKWLEVLGCGIVNPIVLENCNIDSNQYSGLAFGLGIERIAMLKHGVNDIREFYKSNLDFLNQFK